MDYLPSRWINRDIPILYHSHRVDLAKYEIFQCKSSLKLSSEEVDRRIFGVTSVT